ncbi:Beta-glucosidase 12, partial [Ananas comosus]
PNWFRMLVRRMAGQVGFDGTRGGGINKEGIQYYNNLINELISNGIVPFVTLFHWDSPQGLEDEYGGKDFKNYADICFKEFGDRVKQWITFNEPLTYCAQGYAFGAFVPGRCSPWENAKCSAGDAGREPYAVCHNQLLAHATAVELYRHKYQQQQKGQIGITLNTNWFLPYSKSKADDEAVERALDFNYGWFLEPLTRGKYPSSMQSLVGNRLPVFSKTQSELVKGSYDFIGVNYYTASYTYSVSPPPNNVNATFSTDAQINATAIRNGIPIGPQVTQMRYYKMSSKARGVSQAASGWLYIYPPGIRQLLLYTKSKYNNPVIYITENGVDEYNNKTASLKEALNDGTRVSYYKNHLLYVRRAIRDGVNVRGYFAWSLLDNFEWVDGYSVRFGINYVDFNNGLKRYPKRSAHWFKRLLRK